MSVPRTRRLAGAILLPLALASCEKASKRTVLDFACGPTKLRLEETTRDTFETIYHYLDLLHAGPQGWVQVDRSGASWGFGPGTFSRLLPAAVAFRAIPFDGTRPHASGHPGWTVFVDPAKVTRADYDALSACLAANAAAIDRALGSDRPDTTYSHTGSPPQITGTVYSRRDRGFSTCDGPTLGSRWDCADGRTFIKSVMDDQQGQLRLCPVIASPAPGQSPPSQLLMGPDHVTVGTLSQDQAWIFLREGYVSPSAVSAGPDPKAYYATCRDRAGKTLFDTFKLANDPSSSKGVGARR